MFMVVARVRVVLGLELVSGIQLGLVLGLNYGLRQCLG